MNPKHSKLAEKECSELLEFEVIEKFDSHWFRQAIYVNKRSEQETSLDLL